MRGIVGGGKVRVLSKIVMEYKVDLSGLVETKKIRDG